MHAKRPRVPLAAFAHIGASGLPRQADLTRRQSHISTLSYDREEARTPRKYHCARYLLWPHPGGCERCTWSLPIATSSQVQVINAPQSRFGQRTVFVFT